MPTALVTGGTGMIGSHMVDLLVREKVKVRAFVRPSSNLNHLRALPVEIITAEPQDDVSLQNAVRDADWVFHLAAHLHSASAFEDNEDPIPYNRANVDFTSLLLKASLMTPVQRFIYVSSVSVYSLNAVSPIDESTPLAPISAYGRSKMLAEEQVRECQQKGLATTVIRPCIVYGTRDRHFLPLALRLASLPVIPLVNSGRMLLDLVHVSDVVKLIWQAAQSDAAIGREYNAASGVPVSIREILRIYRSFGHRAPAIINLSPKMLRRGAATIRRTLGWVLPGAEAVFSTGLLEYMVQDVYYSMDRAKADLNYTPEIRFEQGLKQILTEDSA